ncbi:unnamed protein product [Macrosiphum euphorbiae]|uniref:Uncharacterized protein n=1 Tax=Macrosiphum euphorbiae TaxID=13131 RepID=A0AAV0VFR1_9HEMI|nr:unnamed protein product [Macrosiphum euphorbiae]
MPVQWSIISYYIPLVETEIMTAISTQVKIDTSHVSAPQVRPTEEDVQRSSGDLADPPGRRSGVLMLCRRVLCSLL